MIETLADLKSMMGVSRGDLVIALDVPAAAPTQAYLDASEALRMREALTKINGEIEDDKTAELRQKVKDLAPEASQVYIRFHPLPTAAWMRIANKQNLTVLQQYAECVRDSFAGVYGDEAAESVLITDDWKVVSETSDVFSGATIKAIIDQFMRWMNRSLELSANPT